MSDRNMSSAHSRLTQSACELLEYKEVVVGFPHLRRLSERTPYNQSFSLFIFGDPFFHNLMVMNSYVLLDLTDLDPRRWKKKLLQRMTIGIKRYSYTHTYIYTHIHFKKQIFVCKFPNIKGCFGWIHLHSPVSIREEYLKIICSRWWVFLAQSRSDLTQ